MLKNKLTKFIKDVSTNIPSDIKKALISAHKKETGRAKKALEVILQNIDLAKKNKVPICQDTGMALFYCYGNLNQTKIKKEIRLALADATKKIPLRTNSVDPITDKNIGNLPIIKFEDTNNSKEKKIVLFFKGGGSENCSSLYSLPDSELSAERHMEGVEKCVLDAVNKAQGKGCPPYIIGVGIAGAADQAFSIAKKQILRSLNDTNKNHTLSLLEKNLLKKINNLGIGPLGFGGKTTAIGVKVGATFRHPASYFVAISFGCWATRKGEIKL